MIGRLYQSVWTMANRSDDQRKAMFANMSNPRSKRKSKGLKRPKRLSSLRGHTKAFIRRLRGKKSLEEIQRIKQTRREGFAKLKLKTSPYIDKINKDQYKQGFTDGKSRNPTTGADE